MRDAPIMRLDVPLFAAGRWLFRLLPLFLLLLRRPRLEHFQPETDGVASLPFVRYRLQSLFEQHPFSASPLVAPAADRVQQLHALHHAAQAAVAEAVHGGRHAHDGVYADAAGDEDDAVDALDLRLGQGQGRIDEGAADAKLDVGREDGGGRSPEMCGWGVGG